MFCDMSSETFKQKLDSVPDQTSSEEQMENWSKETHILDQKKEDFCAGLQSYKNSHKRTEFFIQAETEAPKLSDLQVTCQRGGVLTDCNSGSEESSSVERKDRRMLPEFISSWNGAEDLGGRTETSFLLKELDTLRAKNKKLQDKLAEKDRELKTMKLDLELQDRATEAKIAERIAALVEEVYSAQRERDEAVMARLRLANEERDEAFLRVQRLEESLKELENINPEENDMTLQELLNRINNADTGIDILKNGAIILNRIHRTKERKKKIIAEEMNAVIEQRDAALSQCKRLEQELHHLKEQNQTSANNTRHMTAENNQERALKLLSAKSDRRIMTGPRRGFLSSTQLPEVLMSHSRGSSGKLYQKALLFGRRQQCNRLSILPKRWTKKVTQSELEVLSWRYCSRTLESV
ncbi:mirror-image polydactyly gene 1 protein isoform X5 [Motacilla alba alba]|uniref:mirror-image polydactyly gene 1 protein isoform X5 n=1 Tax=Motacilla alba alba TaxID=1094192 RepID=UPI0018D55F96|nr:mirror-image polydactyly gene 1 protein isoform X5 [Motacilla alba alba]